MYPKQCFGHTCQVSACNSHKSWDVRILQYTNFERIFWSRNVSETTPCFVRKISVDLPARRGLKFEKLVRCCFWKFALLERKHQQFAKWISMTILSTWSMPKIAKCQARGGGTRVHHGRVGSAGLCDLKILHLWRRLKKGVKILQWHTPPPPPPPQR